MAGRIRREDVDLVRERVRLDEVIGEHVALKSAGAGSLKGLCPFHDERSPSFHVRPGTGFYHCLAGETGVLTDEGVVPIRELAGRTARVLARTHGMRNAAWVDAPFSSFGVQPLMRITLGRNGRTKDVFATDQHRWFVVAGTGGRGWKERVTRDLRPGDRLLPNYPMSRVKQNVTPSPSGIARGFTYGDGCRVSRGSCAQFCGEEDAVLRNCPLSRFLEVTDGVARAYDLPAYSKDALPDLGESSSYLYGWLAGYFAADGCVADDGDATLASADRKALEYVEKLCARIGVATNGVTTQVRRGYGTVGSELHSIRFRTSNLTESFFLLDTHRQRFLDADEKYERRRWVVKAVEWSERVEEVFCAVVEGAHNFTLEGNILTGNCFGCEKSGDVFSFVQEVDGVTFVEAVELMAARAGVQVRYEDGGSGRSGVDVGRRQRLLDAHRAAAAFYAEQLSTPAAAVGRAFLAERGFDRAAAEQFGVGYAPAGWGSLTYHLRARGFTTEELLAGGLASQGARGPYDRFRGRLVWPIHDVTGAVIGFGARRLSQDDSGPKYLNTADTPLYRKSSVLYGLDLAKRDIARAHQVVVVEGYTDVMACHLAGVPTAVATCGTAFGADHVAVVRRLMGDDDVRAGQVVFTFDGDEAGQKAALRAFAEDQRFVAQTFVAVAPDGLDPCDLRRARGDEAVRALVAARRPLFEFAIRAALATEDLDTAEGRVRALGAAAPMVAGIKDPSLRPEYTRSLAGWLGMDVTAVQRAVATSGRRGAGGDAGAGRDGVPGGRGAQRGRGPDAGGAPSRGPVELDPVAAAERQLLALVVQEPSAVPAFDELPGGAFSAPASRAVHDLVRAAGGVAAAVAAGGAWAEQLREAASDDVRPLISQLAVVLVPGSGAEALTRLAGDLLRGVTDRDLLRQEAELRGRAQRLESTGDPAAAAAFAELVAVTTRRQQLRTA